MNIIIKVIHWMVELRIEKCLTQYRYQGAIVLTCLLFIFFLSCLNIVREEAESVYKCNIIEQKMCSALCIIRFYLEAFLHSVFNMSLVST